MPAVIATAAADGTPNVTYLSRVHIVDDERVALSNQFFSKTSRNLAENPRASVLLIDPVTYDEYRLTWCTSAPSGGGRVFERLRADVEAIAALTGMQDVFRLRAADIYRVLHIEQVLGRGRHDVAAGRCARAHGRRHGCGAAGGADAPAWAAAPTSTPWSAPTVAAWPSCSATSTRCCCCSTRTATRLYTIASHGYTAEGVGSEVAVGEGIIGMAAARCAPMRVGNLAADAPSTRRSVRRSYEARRRRSRTGDPGARACPAARARWPCRRWPGAARRRARRRVHRARLAFDADRRGAARSWSATVVANAIEIDRARERAAEPDARGRAGRRAAPVGAGPRTLVRCFAADGSVFLDGEYLIKGVAGRILWVLLAATTTPRAASSSPTGRCASTRRSSCPSSATTSRAG